MLIEFCRGVDVEIDVTPSWWREGRRAKYAALGHYFAGEPAGRGRFKYATAIKLGIESVTVSAKLPRGVDFAAAVEAMRGDLERMRAEMVEPTPEGA
jgi:hypothetical protein